MSVTLAQAALLSNDVLLKGIIETIIKESPILARMPFIEINGNALTYNRELALAGMEWHAANDVWTESAPTWEQKTASLTILGGDADVDNFIRQTRSNIQDIEAAVIELKTKALIHEYEDKFLYGDGLANVFEGLIKLINTAAASDQLIATAAAGNTALTLSMVDQLIDAVLGGKPDMLMMSKRTRRKLTALMRAAGTFYEMRDEFGMWIQTYNGIPVLVNDWIKNTHHLASSVEDSYTSGTDSSIYAFTLGEGALAGVSNGMIQIERLGSLETKDATRTRIKFYCGLALFNVKKAAALVGIAA